MSKRRKKIEEFSQQHHQVVDDGGGRDGMSRNIIDFVISPAFSLPLSALVL